MIRVRAVLPLFLLLSLTACGSMGMTANNDGLPAVTMQSPASLEEEVAQSAVLLEEVAAVVTQETGIVWSPVEQDVLAPCTSSDSPDATGETASSLTSSDSIIDPAQHDTVLSLVREIGEREGYEEVFLVNDDIQLVVEMKSPSGASIRLSSGSPRTNLRFFGTCFPVEP